jgi:hypothetical protein
MIIKDMIFYDLKRPQKRIPFPRHLFAEINNWENHLGKLEEGSVSPYFPSMMLGRKLNFILIGMLHLGWSLWRFGRG